MLVLTNIWDAAGARLVEQTGFPAVATSSSAVASSLGYSDDDSMPVEAAFDAVGRIARSVSVPVSADLEAGYRLGAAELAQRLLESGAAGCNLEDSDHHGGTELIDPEIQAFRLGGIREAAKAIGFEPVINARVDTFRFHEQTSEALDDAIVRAMAYLEAGADCVYPIGLTEERLIGEFVQRVQAPVNIWARNDAPSLKRLSELGVRRVSHAADLMRGAYERLHKDLENVHRTAQDVV